MIKAFAFMLTIDKILEESLMFMITIAFNAVIEM